MRTTEVGAMSDPIVFISHHRIKRGKAEELKALTAEIWSEMETEKPQTLMNLAFVNQEGTEVTFMHAFADIEGMRLHWEGADERAQQAYDSVEPIGLEGDHLHVSLGDAHRRLEPGVPHRPHPDRSVRRLPRL